MLENKEIAKYIRKYGVCKRRPAGKDKGLYETKCQGCGEVIRSDGDLSDVELSVNSRGSANFFHSRCFRNVWDHGIV